MIEKLPEEIQKAIHDKDNFKPAKVCPKGGCGYVVIGTDTVLDRKVAIKFIYSDDANLTEEPRKLFAIDHPNVLKVYEAKIFDTNGLYFVTPVATGGDLDDYIAKGGVSLRKALSITHGILDGINQLHSPPEVYLHRDVKPSNIFMNCDIPLIGDFGSIRKTMDVKHSTNASKMSLFFNTPEGIKTKKHYIESDVYQIGLILYMLLGGKLSYSPIEYMSAKEKAKHARLSDSFDLSEYEDSIVHRYICNGKIIDRNSLPSFIPKRVNRILANATNRNYRKRYSNATDFMRDIANTISEVPDWKYKHSEIQINNYKNRDYKIAEDRSRYYVFKKMSKASKWRKIKESKSDNIDTAVKQLEKLI